MNWYQKPIPEARTFALGDRRDGVTGVIGVARYAPGEILGLAIDAEPYLGPAWLESVDNIVVTASEENVGEGALTVTDSITHEGAALLLVDASAALVGDQYTITCQLHPVAVEKVVAVLLVVIDAD